MEKVVLYGMGRYAIKKLKEYGVRVDYIEAIIDKHSAEVTKYFKGDEIKVLTWDDFVENRENYSAKRIVIASILYKEEIINQVLESGLFNIEEIVYIDEWVNEIFGNGTQVIDLIEYSQDSNDNVVDKVTVLEEKLLKNAVLIPDRGNVLKRFSKDMIVAEVGVAFGDFSKKILEEMAPKKFYAIDVFNENTKGFWGYNKFEETGMNHYDWYANRFAKEIGIGKMYLRKGLSWEVLEEFPDNYFDYVYLDADHNYSSVLKDVEVLKKKVKNNGIIQFNDYIIYDHIRSIYYGVVPVVNELIMDTQSEVLYYCFNQGGFDDIVVQLHK